MLLWKWSAFSKLSGREVYEIIQLRERVFAVEQKCIYLDADGKDLSAWHLFGRMGELGEIVCYLRVLPPGLRFDEHSIGRVVTAPAVRGKKLGEMLMREGLQRIEDTFGTVPIRISAQSYLQKFYERLRFSVCSEPYLEDDIPHLEMIRRTSAD